MTDERTNLYARAAEVEENFREMKAEIGLSRHKGNPELQRFFYTIRRCYGWIERKPGLSRNKDGTPCGPLFRFARCIVDEFLAANPGRLASPSDLAVYKRLERKKGPKRT